MKKKNNSLSYGPYLRALRLEKDIQMKTVVRKTHISTKYLIALEAENTAELPDEVFVKGFIRSYAVAIDADADEAVRRYISKHEKRSPTELKPSSIFLRTKSWLRLTTLAGILVGAIAFSVYAMSLPEFAYESDHPWHYRLIKSLTFSDDSSLAQAASNNGADKHTSDIPIPQFTDSDDSRKKTVLKIIIKEKTWIRLTTDALAPKNYKLNGGDCLEFEVIPYMQLAIGCADNVKLLLNDKILDVSDKDSHTLTFKTPL
ncbi:helix-turn-helix domain-containing protein [Desulfococcaceae bacterium HSG7]|nr:helix-turn-helix domain-containing protein [Desulfococcaceae bacterium HSG7]